MCSCNRHQIKQRRVSQKEMQTCNQMLGCCSFYYTACITHEQSAGLHLGCLVYSLYRARSLRGTDAWGGIR
jgi:hypothetical protein